MRQSQREAAAAALEAMLSEAAELEGRYPPIVSMQAQGYCIVVQCSRDCEPELEVIDERVVIDWHGRALRYQAEHPGTDIRAAMHETEGEE